MDRLDLRIVRELTQGGPALHLLPPGPNASSREISQNLGIPESTVRSRVAKLRGCGFLGDARVLPNPSLLGLQMGAYGISVGPSVPKRVALDRLRAVDGVFVLQDYHGPNVGIAFLYDSEPGPAEQLSTFDQLAGSGRGFFTRIPLPPSQSTLAGRDWDLLSHIAVKGLRPHRELASDLGLSTRTVMRRIASLSASRGFFSFVRLNLRAIPGGAAADAMVRFASAGHRASVERRVIEALDDYLFYAGPWEPVGVYNLVIPNAGTATDLAARLSLIDGVLEASVELVDDHLETPGGLGDFLARRIAIVRDALPRPSYPTTRRTLRSHV